MSEISLTNIAYVDQSECTSCHQCADELPDVFQMDSEDLALVHNSSGGTEEEIQDSMDSCPGECIHWKAKENE